MQIGFLSTGEAWTHFQHNLAQADSKTQASWAELTGGQETVLGYGRAWSSVLQRESVRNALGMSLATHAVAPLAAARLSKGPLHASFGLAVFPMLAALGASKVLYGNTKPGVELGATAAATTILLSLLHRKPASLARLVLGSGLIGAATQGFPSYRHNESLAGIMTANFSGALVMASSALLGAYVKNPLLQVGLGLVLDYGFTKGEYDLRSGLGLNPGDYAEFMANGVGAGALGSVSHGLLAKPNPATPAPRDRHDLSSMPQRFPGDPLLVGTDGRLHRAKKPLLDLLLEPLWAQGSDAPPFRLRSIGIRLGVPEKPVLNYYAMPAREAAADLLHRTLQSIHATGPVELNVRWAEGRNTRCIVEQIGLEIDCRNFRSGETGAIRIELDMDPLRLPGEQQMLTSVAIIDLLGQHLSRGAAPRIYRLFEDIDDALPHTRLVDGQTRSEFCIIAGGSNKVTVSLPSPALDSLRQRFGEDIVRHLANDAQPIYAIVNNAGTVGVVKLSFFEESLGLVSTAPCGKGVAGPHNIDTIVQVTCTEREAALGAAVLKLKGPDRENAEQLLALLESGKPIHVTVPVAVRPETFHHFTLSQLLSAADGAVDTHSTLVTRLFDGTERQHVLDELAEFGLGNAGRPDLSVLEAMAETPYQSYKRANPGVVQLFEDMGLDGPTLAGLPSAVRRALLPILQDPISPYRLAIPIARREGHVALIFKANNGDLSRRVVSREGLGTALRQGTFRYPSEGISYEVSDLLAAGPLYARSRVVKSQDPLVSLLNLPQEMWPYLHPTIQSEDMWPRLQDLILSQVPPMGSVPPRIQLGFRTGRSIIVGGVEHPELMVVSVSPQELRQALFAGTVSVGPDRYPLAEAR